MYSNESFSLGSLLFIRSRAVVKDDTVILLGVDLGGWVSCVARFGDFEVWRKESGTVWAGRFSPREYVPVEYYLVQVVPAGDRQYRAYVLMNCQPQRRSKMAKTAFITQAIRCYEIQQTFPIANTRIKKGEER